MSNEILKPLVAEEGYCCLYGYLKLCKARGETPDTMSKHMGVASSTIRYHYTRIFSIYKPHKCAGEESCMSKLWQPDDKVKPPIV